MPKDESLWPYILLHQYLTNLPSGSNLDLSKADSLKGLFASIETTLGTTGPSAGNPSAGLLADLVQSINSRITEIATTSEAIEGSALLAPIALSGLKQLIQSHTLAGYLLDLRQFNGSNQALQNRSERLIESFSGLLNLPRSSATGDRFAGLGWAVDGVSGQVSLSLDHDSNELGAFANLWIDTNLIYGSDYRLKGYSSLPQHLSITPGDDHLDLTIEVLNTNLSGATLNLHLLDSAAGIQGNNNSQVLQVSINSDIATSTVASASANPLPLTGSHVIKANNQGVFTLTKQSGPPYLLVDFDPLLGHRIDSSETSFTSDELRIINGLLYTGTKAIGAVLSATINGRELLSYADQLAPATPDPDAGQTWRGQEQTMQEDQAKTFSLITLLNGLGLSNQAEVIHVAATPRLAVTRNGDTLTITPEADVCGKGSVVLSILDGSKLSTLVVPLNVVGTADAPVLLEAIELSMNEDGSLTVPEGLLGSTIVDRDVFGDVKVLNLISNAANTGNFTITHHSSDHTFTIEPAADINGNFSFDLQVESSSGTYTLEKTFNLTVKAEDDIPEARGTLVGDLTSKTFLRIDNGVVPGGNINDPKDHNFGLIDGDGDAIDGIRITSYPSSGELRWQSSPPIDLGTLGDGIEPFDLITHGIISLQDLENGRLIYIPDNQSSSENRPSDFFTFVIAQKRGGKTIESSPCIFNIGDTLDDDINAIRPSIVNSNITYSKNTDLATITVDFNQALTLEGGGLRVWLKNPSQPELTPTLLLSQALNQSQLSNDGKTLTIKDFQVPQNIEGVLSFDLTSQANTLKNVNAISLSGDPQRFSLLV
ncbi:MAG: cadherin-like domain-containing protein, partial [Cyanobacteriota bacterium]